MDENCSKWEFEFLDGPLQGKTQRIYDGLVVGRHSDCDVQIRVGQLSRRHAKFKCDASGLRIQDLGSANGTYVNGSKIQNQSIRAGDRVTLDQITLRISAIESYSGATEVRQPAPRATQGHRLAPNAAIAEPPRREGHPQGPALMGVSSPYKNKLFHLGGGKITIGKSSENDIVIIDNSVSALHAQLIEANGAWKLLNLLSENGTFVNEQRIQTATLHNGDQLRFGTRLFNFYTGPRQRDNAQADTHADTPVKKLLQIFVATFIVVSVVIAALVYAYYEFY